MGHEILTYKDHHAVFRDEELWVVRHFLLAEATESRHLELARFIGGWEWVGNGVYIGLDFDAFLNEDTVRLQSFAEAVTGAIRRVQAFGEFVPLSYLQAYVNGPGAEFSVALPTAHVFSVLGKIREVVAADETAV